MHWQGTLDLHPEAVANPQAADTAAQSVRNPEWPSAIIEQRGGVSAPG